MANEPQQGKKHDPDKVRRDALRDLDRVNDTSEVFGTSAFARAANKAKNHLNASDKDTNDQIEVWGTRIARILAVGFVIYLIYTLVNMTR
ncbi:MAG: hypothetical protein ABJO09_18025 [Hyphomicrobiales bacterium]